MNVTRFDIVSEDGEWYDKHIQVKPENWLEKIALKIRMGYYELDNGIFEKRITVKRPGVKNIKRYITHVNGYPYEDVKDNITLN